MHGTDNINFARTVPISDASTLQALVSLRQVLQPTKFTVVHRWILSESRGSVSFICTAIIPGHCPRNPGQHLSHQASSKITLLLRQPRESYGKYQSG